MLFSVGMPIYFFDTYNASTVIKDIEGRELPDLATARLEAIEDSRELISTAIFRAENIMLGGLRVCRDGHGEPEFILPFSDVISGLRS